MRDGTGYLRREIADPWIENGRLEVNSLHLPGHRRRLRGDERGVGLRDVGQNGILNLVQWVAVSEEAVGGIPFEKIDLAGNGERPGACKYDIGREGFDEIVLPQGFSAAQPLFQFEPRTLFENPRAGRTAAAPGASVVMIQGNPSPFQVARQSGLAFPELHPHDQRGRLLDGSNLA